MAHLKLGYHTQYVSYELHTTTLQSPRGDWVFHEIDGIVFVCCEHRMGTEVALFPNSFVNRISPKNLRSSYPPVVSCDGLGRIMHQCCFPQGVARISPYNVFKQRLLFGKYIFTEGFDVPIRNTIRIFDLVRLLQYACICVVSVDERML